VIKKLLFAILIFSSFAWADQYAMYFSYVDTATSAASSSAQKQIGLSIGYHKLAWNKVGTVSACAVKVQQSADGSTSWTDLIAAQTCTSNGATAITAGTPNYIRITFSTPVSGSGSVTAGYSGYINLPLTDPPTFASFTEGSIPYFGTGGLLSQDNANLYWDHAAYILKLGGYLGVNGPAAWPYPLTVKVATNTRAGLSAPSGAVRLVAETESYAFMPLNLWADAVGIRTDTPAERLHVYNGNARVDFGHLKFVSEATPGAPTSSAPTAGGACTAGTHVFVTTFVTANGETQYGAASSAQTCGANATVPLSAIPTGTSGVTTGRNICASKAGTTTPLYLAAASPVIADNSTTTYSFVTADAALTVACNLVATTSGGFFLDGTKRIQISSVTGGVAFGAYAGAYSPPANGIIVSGPLGVGATSITTAKFLDVHGPAFFGTAATAVTKLFLTFNSLGTNYAHFYETNTAGKHLAVGGSGAVDSVPSAPVMAWDHDGGKDTHANRLKYSLGTATAAGDYALSAGWGNTASVAVATGSNDQRGTITITSAGIGQAVNATITLTFKDGTWTTAPFALAKQEGGTGVISDCTEVASATTLIITFTGLPVAASTYIFTYIVLG
jgi:hypothetical protein